MVSDDDTLDDDTLTYTMIWYDYHINILCYVHGTPKRTWYYHGKCTKKIMLPSNVFVSVKKSKLSKNGG